MTVSFRSTLSLTLYKHTWAYRGHFVAKQYPCITVVNGLNFYKQLIGLYTTCAFEHLLATSLKANLVESYDHVVPCYIQGNFGILELLFVQNHYILCSMLVVIL